MLYAGAGTAIDSLSRFPALQNIVSTCAHLRSNLRSLIFVFLVEWQKQWHCLCYPFVLLIASSIVLMLCRLLEKEFKGYLFTARANEIVKIYTFLFTLSLQPYKDICTYKLYCKKFYGQSHQAYNLLRQQRVQEHIWTWIAHTIPLTLHKITYAQLKKNISATKF